MEYLQPTHKFVAVLNKKAPVSRLMNALGHMTAGLAASYPRRAELRLDDYRDASGTVHPHISDNPFIVLRADNSNQIRNLRTAAQAAELPVVDFTNTMIEGTYAEQHARTAATPEAELEYFGLVLFGEIELLNQLTKKFSLFRD